MRRLKGELRFRAGSGSERVRGQGRFGVRAGSGSEQVRGSERVRGQGRFGVRAGSGFRAGSPGSERVPGVRAGSGFRAGSPGFRACFRGSEQVRGSERVPRGQSVNDRFTFPSISVHALSIFDELSMGLRR